ncbi:hypothetical protein NE237_009077 [Protea cynaroides]|uniref:BED-type domain-containing protein n=1 Tax=Protea cynaroides TaxID=273540 RepID=A0A9Q0R0A1_9MAGN|nr:hypothetical protein NE237_009077 [Protea cynaroides]
MATPLNELTTGDIMEGVGTPNVDDLSDDGPLIMPPDSAEAVSSVPIKYGKRKRRSSVWEGFKVIPGDTYDDGKERAECLKCKIVYRADTCINGTGTLRRHLKNCPKQDNKDVKQMMLGNQGKMELRERNIDLNLEFSTFDSAMFIERYGKSQLDYYLEEPKLPFDDKYRQFDVLAYWRQNGSKYPDVARMAKDVLSIPVSTVASESAFSAGGRVIDKYRSKLLPSNAEALICLRDWMFDIDFRAEPVDDAEDVAMALGNVLITDELPMPANLVGSTVPPSSFAATLMAND